MTEVLYTEQPLYTVVCGVAEEGDAVNRYVQNLIMRCIPGSYDPKYGPLEKPDRWYVNVTEKYWLPLLNTLHK